MTRQINKYGETEKVREESLGEVAQAMAWEYFPRDAV